MTQEYQFTQTELETILQQINEDEYMNELLEKTPQSESIITSILFDKPESQQLPRPIQYQLNEQVTYPERKLASPPLILEVIDDSLLSVNIIDDAFFQKGNSHYIATDNSIHSTAIGQSTYDIFLRYAQTLDFSYFEKTLKNAITSKTTDRYGNKLIVIRGDNIPFRNEYLTDNQMRFFYYYLIKQIDEYVNKKYSVVYIDSEDTLPLDLFQYIIGLFPKKYSDNLHKFFFILNDFIEVEVVTKCLSKEQSSKITFVKDLFTFYKDIPVGAIDLDEWIIKSYATKEHQIFGLSIEEASIHNYRGFADFPIVIELSIQYLSTDVDKISLEGIFRMSGQKNIVDSYIDAFNHCKIMSFDSSEDPHVVCSIMKTYLQQLPEPVLTKKWGMGIVQAFVQYENHPSEDQKKILIGKIQENFIRLPKSHRKVLLALINIANLIASQSQSNLMDEENIGKIFGPCVYWRNDMSLRNLNEVNSVNSLFTFFMKNISSFVEILLDER